MTRLLNMHFFHTQNNSDNQRETHIKQEKNSIEIITCPKKFQSLYNDYIHDETQQPSTLHSLTYQKISNAVGKNKAQNTKELLDFYAYVKTQVCDENDTLTTAKQNLLLAEIRYMLAKSHGEFELNKEQNRPHLDMAIYYANNAANLRLLPAKLLHQLLRFQYDYPYGDESTLIAGINKVIEKGYSYGNLALIKLLYYYRLENLENLENLQDFDKKATDEAQQHKQMVTKAREGLSKIQNDIPTNILRIKLALIDDAVCSKNILKKIYNLFEPQLNNSYKNEIINELKNIFDNENYKFYSQEVVDCCKLICHCRPDIFNYHDFSEADCKTYRNVFLSMVNSDKKQHENSCVIEMKSFV